MRTTGTFQDVFMAARDIFADPTDCPMSPVIRRSGDEWMLESGLEPEPVAHFECDLDTFDSYFSEDYESGYVPTDADADEFQQICIDNSDYNWVRK